MLGMNDLKPGSIIEIKGDPHEVLEAHHSKVARRQAVTQTKIRNLISGKVLTQTFQQSDKIPEANIDIIEAVFKYRTRDEFFFIDKKGKKIGLKVDILGDKINYLKEDVSVKMSVFEEKIISIELPIKISFIVKEAPPGEKGNTAQGGTKDVILETGVKLKTPFFVKEGDNVEVNTQTGEYARRVNN